MAFLMSPGCCCDLGTECCVGGSRPSAYMVTFSGVREQVSSPCDECEVLDIPYEADDPTCDYRALLLPGVCTSWPTDKWRIDAYFRYLGSYRLMAVHLQNSFGFDEVIFGMNKLNIPCNYTGFLPLRTLFVADSCDWPTATCYVEPVFD